MPFLFEIQAALSFCEEIQTIASFVYFPNI